MCSANGGVRHVGLIMYSTVKFHVRRGEDLPQAHLFKFKKKSILLEKVERNVLNILNNCFFG